MKKFITIFSIVLTIALLCSTVVFAFDRTANCGNYADADNNGICDNRDSMNGGNYEDADSDGVCDNRNSVNCGNYADADNNGVCDNRENAVCNSQQSRARHGNQGKHRKNQK